MSDGLFQAIGESLLDSIVKALSVAIQDSFGVVRAFLADTVGQLLVAVYTPFYCIGDFFLSFFQVVFGLYEMVFGFLPEPLWLTSLALLFLAVLTFMILFLRGMIK